MYKRQDEKDDKIKSTGHHSILKFKDKYYIVYHRFNTLDRYPIAQKLRQVAADELLFNTDGSIKRVVTTNRGLAALKDAGQKVNLAFNARVTSSSDLDSSVTSAKNAVDENNATLWIGGNYAQEWITVSYTHLDVYKRQLLKCTVRIP